MVDALSVKKPDARLYSDSAVGEERMRKRIGFALALAFILSASPARAAEAGSAHPRHHRQYRPTSETERRPRPAVQPQPEESLLPSLTPYARSGEGNNNGLSRNPDDCVTGCIGGNAD